MGIGFRVSLGGIGWGSSEESEQGWGAIVWWELDVCLDKRQLKGEGEAGDCPEGLSSPFFMPPASFC